MVEDRRLRAGVFGAGALRVPSWGRTLPPPRWPRWVPADVGTRIAGAEATAHIAGDPTRLRSVQPGCSRLFEGIEEACDDRVIRGGLRRAGEARK